VDAQLSPVVCFLDESATDAKDTHFAVLAGGVLNRSDLPTFELEWREMLRRHGVTDGLHMVDLGPGGKYPELVGDRCCVMLTEAVAIINKFRIFTFAATWHNRKHELLFSASMRQRFLSVYGLLFMMAVEINRGSGKHAGYEKRIDYVLDDGNQFKGQVDEMHNSISTLTELFEHKVGSLTFKSDSEQPALQAADMIAWSVRRRLAGKPLVGVHQPLNALFDQFFTHSPAPDRVVRQMSRRFALAEQNIDPDTLRGRILIALPLVFISTCAFGMVLILLRYVWTGLLVSLLTAGILVELRRRVLWMR